MAMLGKRLYPSELSYESMIKDDRTGTGKKTPGGAGTHTGHTGAHGHTDHTDKTSQPSKPTNPRPSVAAGSREANR